MDVEIEIGGIDGLLPCLPLSSYHYFFLYSTFVGPMYTNRNREFKL